MKDTTSGPPSRGPLPVALRACHSPSNGAGSEYVIGTARTVGDRFEIDGVGYRVLYYEYSPGNAHCYSWVSVCYAPEHLLGE